MFLSDPRDTAFTFGEPRDTAFTFGEPGGNDGFAQVLASLGDRIKANAGRTIEDDLAAQRSYAEDIRRATVAAERQTRLVDTINARESALAEAADLRIKTVQQATGVQLENPFSGGYLIEANRRVDDARARGEAIDNRSSRVQDEQRRIFTERLDEAAQNHPDQAAALSFYQPLEEQAQAIAKAAAYDGEHAPGGIGPFMASLAGGIWGSRRDPLFMASLFAGPAWSAAKTVIGRIGMGALKQGLFNAGLQAAAQPAVQDWRREIGERSGVVPALENVGMAFLFGAIPGAAIEGGRALLAPPARAALERITTGRAEPADLRTAADALGVKIDPQAEAAVKTAAADEGHAAAALGEPPPGVPAAEHAEIAAQAVRHAEDPVNQPPPDLPLVASPRAADLAAVVDERTPAALGSQQTVDGKPVTFERFDPQALTTDAAAFQYKGGGDAAGVTDRLRNVATFDPLASGKTLVFERADGTRVIADGHQRLGLAKRLGGDDASIRLDGFVFREKDGWTPEDVRSIAAKKNMQEGSGDALDAARILRDRPDLLDGSMPVSSPMMKNAVALSRLSDEAFGMAINGVVPPGHAAAVGAMVPDRLQHASVLADLIRFAPETEREARLLIGEIMASGFRAEQQISLFGAAETTRSLMGERVKVLDAAMTGLARDRRLFGTLADKADAIEAAGNQLARGANDARARDAAQLQDLLGRLARRAGPVSDALNRAAAQMADGMKAAKAADGFLEQVRALLDRDGLAGLLSDPELKPRAVVEPGTPDGLAAAETASNQRMVLVREHLPDASPNEVSYSITRANGDQVGFADFVITGDTATLKDIANYAFGFDRKQYASVRHAIGTRQMRDLLNQFRALHPEVNKITAERVSGARFGGVYKDVVDAVDITVPLPKRQPAAAAHQASPAASQGPSEFDAFTAGQSGFDNFDNNEPSLFEAVAVAGRDNASDVRYISLDAALAEADKATDHADLVASCKS